ncbi:cupin domain-containing protein [Nocardiopsis sp. LOL_012]|uniref:cupin domain-containing protein n=1 Tax=Nocardiopsis sp. LOL_012 TaxID=3345409 RepID=UPI003A8BDF40
MAMNYVLHMTELSRWRHGTGDLEPETLHTDGFVYASPNEHAMLAVANTLYHQVKEPFCVLVIDTLRLSCEVHWQVPARHITLVDPPGGTAPDEDTPFPHIYGPIPRESVVGVRYLRREPPGVFTSVDQRGPTAEALDLFPYPEGGWFRHTWSSGVSACPPGYDGERQTASAMQYLLCAGDRCRWHRLRQGALWSFARGGPAIIELGGDGQRPETEHRYILGPHVEAGQYLQVHVPPGVWQTLRPMTAEETLATAVASPAFEFDDLEVTGEQRGGQERGPRAADAPGVPRQRAETVRRW